MQLLHLSLVPQGETHIELRYFFENPNQYLSRSLPRQEIADLLAAAETDYYVPAALQDLAGTGKRLYEWLDGSDRWLGRTLGQSAQGTVLAIAAEAALAHLPWELLHDGTSFLVQRVPAVVPLRWVSVLGGRTINQLQPRDQPQNRALNLMFMATSPQGIAPVLDFEREEGRILEATQRQPLSLLVEESGSLEGLGFALKAHSQGHFDGLHLTGHATFEGGQPRFVMETETGEPAYVGAADIAATLEGCLPPLLFLSGCRTGQGAQAGAVPSMAEALLAKGATAVLGWGQRVLDTDATEAAAILYGELSQGQPLVRALAKTYRHLLKAEARDWHLLRLYVAGTLPTALVTPLRTLGRKLAPPPSVVSEFLDPVSQKVKVVGRQGFVGRRRQIQACLRVLSQAPDQAGVLIHGMGGLGKSALALRLCDRMPQTQRIVWVGHLDGPVLVRKLSGALDDHTLREMLQDSKEELRFRLRRLFQTLIDQARPPLLLVLDDFEANLEPRGGAYIPTPTAAALLDDLLWAMQQTHYTHRLIITSRYDVDFSRLGPVYRQPLDALHGADLRKKCSGLVGFQPPLVDSAASEEKRRAIEQTRALQQRALHLADGNPRLLEWLDKILLQEIKGQAGEKVNVAAILDQLDQNPVELREQVLAKSLLDQMDADLSQMLRRGLVYELPVPPAALEAVYSCPPGEQGLAALIPRAIALGLLEVSPQGDLRVPRILPLTLSDVPEAELETLWAAAAQTLYRLWWQGQDDLSEDQALELVRLGLQAREQEIAVEVGDRVAAHWVNSSRYTEAFALCTKILEVFEDYRILGTIARAEEVLGLVAEALSHYEAALHRCPEESPERKAAMLSNMALVIAQQGDIERAIALWQESLEIIERIGDVQGKATTLNNMALVIAQQGDIERAIALWQESLEILERIGDVQGKAAMLGNMAGVIAQQGDIERAIALWQESLEISERIGDVKGKAATLNNMARIIAQQGNIEQAIALCQESLEISERIGDVKGKATTLNNIAEMVAQQGNIEQAIALCQESLEILERIGDVKGKATTLNNMAGVIAQQGDIERAIALWQESLEISERIGDVKGKAATLSNMAGVIAQQGEIERAIALWQESLEILERIGDVKGKAATLSNMAGIAYQQGELEQALKLFREAAVALGQMRAFGDLFTVLGNLGVADEEQSQIYRAQALWLALRIQTPLTSTLNLLRYFFNQVKRSDELEALLATTALYFCQIRGQGHPQIDQLQQTAIEMLASAAAGQGNEVDSIEALLAWFTQQQLNDASMFLPQLNQRLEAIVGDQWLFDRQGFGQGH